MDVALFVYGTLLDDARLHALTGRRFTRRAASLPDHRRVTGPAGYPSVMPSAGDAVDGVLLDDVDPASLEVLDAYEDVGRLYRREAASVTVDGHAVPCQLYVAIDDARR